MSTEVADHNPAHPKALAADDLWLGRPIIVYDYVKGILPFVVVGGPYLFTRLGGLGGHLAHCVKLKSVRAGTATVYSLTHIGVEPDRDGKWDLAVFTVDANDEDSLPSLNETPRARR